MRPTWWALIKSFGLVIVFGAIVWAGLIWFWWTL